MLESHTRRTFLKRGIESVAGLTMAGNLASGALSVNGQPSRNDNDSLVDLEPDAFCFSRLRYTTIEPTRKPWNHLPEYDDAFLKFLNKVTNVKVSEKSFNERVIGVEDLHRIFFEANSRLKIFLHPFLFMTGQSRFVLSRKQGAALGEYIKRGGFLWADDCVDRNMLPFSHCVIRQIDKILPNTIMERVPPSHEIYHCFYDIPDGSPYCWGERLGDHGLFYDNRLAIFLTPNDVHCGMARDAPRFIPYREACLKIAANVVIYALTH